MQKNEQICDPFLKSDSDSELSEDSEEALMYANEGVCGTITSNFKECLAASVAARSNNNQSVVYCSANWNKE